MRSNHSPRNSYLHANTGICFIQQVKQNPRAPALFEREALTRAGGFRIDAGNPRGAVRTEVAPKRVSARRR